MSLGDVSLACASVVVDELARSGMRDACLSPGSRSTPIALALDRHPDITLHVHLDERSSAFFALGLSKATGRPVAAACTSGTATAEFLPAVVEAFQSRVQLILLTADRPPRLRGTGANQTINQVRLYGTYAAYVELPLPEEPVPDGRLRVAVMDAMRGAAFRIPVHLNMPFDESLMPEDIEVAIDETPVPDIPAAPAPSRRHVEEAEALAREATDRRGVVLIGGMIDVSATDETFFDVPDGLGWPVLAEPVSGGRLPGRVLSAGQALLGSPAWLAANTPEVVLQLGAAPTTRATQALIARAERLVVIDTHYPDPDPDSRATLRIRDDPVLVMDEFWGRSFLRDDAASAGWVTYTPETPPSFDELMACRVGPAPEGWFESWQLADGVARKTLDAALDAYDEPTELRIARDLAAWMPPGGTLFVGNSMPVRDLDYAMAPRQGLRVLANRGASGIDGLVSTALGIAAADGAPTVALLGDLSLLHDIGALVWSGTSRIDVTIVVINNGGGTIFSFLPQRDLPEFSRLFATPHGVDLGAICAAAGSGHERVERIRDFNGALERATAAGGVQMVEVMVDQSRNRAHHLEVQAAVDTALGSLV
jgi:2-succinyl-5-enolpyruvyl-6-hydroxy-3-cyclohexene-1-carboxylate synthase